jgi:DNA-binding transcriptional ArsR family regulator
MTDPCDTRVLLLKGLANPHRALIFALLLVKERSVSELCECLGAFPGTISRHLDEMGLGGLVVSRGDGTWRIYRVAHPKAFRKLAAALDEANEAAFPGGPKTTEDRLAAFLKRRDDDERRKRKAG